MRRASTSPNTRSRTNAIWAMVEALTNCRKEHRDQALRLFKQLSSGELDNEDKVQASATLLMEILYPPAESEEGVRRAALVKSKKRAGQARPHPKSILAMKDSEKLTFADRVRSLMAEKSMTQVQLASLTGLGQPAISMLLQRSSRPQRRTVLRFATGLKVDPAILWPGFQ